MSDRESDAEVREDTATTTEPTTPEADEPTRKPSAEEGTVKRLTIALNYAVLAGLLLLAAISAVQLYLAVGRTISTFVVYEYRAPLMVAFNLAVLLSAALGISLQLRRLSGSGENEA